ncbi:rab-GTPase-TBC domain-containing protein [Chytridium lagenaria]|nr:rab-GTPase-TBC domain-containing protein [Chytridium lagenaria]
MIRDIPRDCQDAGMMALEKVIAQEDAQRGRARTISSPAGLDIVRSPSETRSIASSPSCTFSPVRKRKVDLGPVVRDRYGFKRSFEFVSKEDQDAFNIYYAGVCERRRAKWESLLRKNAGQLPQKAIGGDKLKRYIRKGIPHELRTRCWLYYSGAQRDMEENPGLFTMLVYREEQDRSQGYTRETNKLLEFIEIIERDLHRTFPENIHFNPTPIIFDPTAHLATSPAVLIAFSYYSWPHPDETRAPPRSCTYRIGYCQSLNFIAGLLLLVDARTSGSNGVSGATSEGGMAFGAGDEETALKVEERTFFLLVAIVERLLPLETYGASLEGAQIAQEVLWNWLLGEKGVRFGVSRVAKWVGNLENDIAPSLLVPEEEGVSKTRGSGNMPPLSMVTTSWFMTLFVNVLPIETVLRVWDNFFFQGEKVLMRVTLTLIKIHEDQVLACRDPTEAWKVVKSIPPRMIDCHRLMEICFKPRLSLNPFDTEPSTSNPALSRGGSTSSITIDDSDDDGPQLSMNDAVRVSGEAGNEYLDRRLGRYHRRGVGSVPSKLIKYYRDLALQERRERSGPV